MKIIYQFLNLDPSSQMLPIISTVLSVIAFAGLVAWAFMLSKRYTSEMSQLPSEKETNE